MDAIVSRDVLERAVAVAMASAGEMQWGRDDCALWCIDIVRSVLDYDPAAVFRGRYRTKIGAHRVLGKAGLAGAFKAEARRRKWHRVTVGSEQVGDLGIAHIGGIQSTVICRAPGWFIGRNENGWTALPSKYVRIIWSVI